MKQTCPKRLGRGAEMIVVVAAVTLAALVLAARPAQAGTYRATQCNSTLGAGSGDLSFHRTSSHYAGHADCHGGGLTIRHVEGNKPTRSGRFGAWSLSSPSGARIISASVRIAGQGRSGHRPELMLATAHNKQRRLGRIAGAVHTVAWKSSAGADALTARLRCARHGHCGSGRGALLAVHRVSLVISDVIGPALGLGGPIYEPGAHRGRQTLSAVASDAGGGVHSVGVEVNGRTVGSKPNRCAIKGNVALRLRPCPEHVVSSFPLRTASAPFRQGLNQIRVCASDFARDSAANRRCSRHDVRVDNLCPLAGATAATLRASFAHGRSHATIRSDDRALVRGRLSDSSGDGVAGARICLASTTRGDRYETERIVATPLTDGAGRFRVALPKGPSRAIRVATWPGARTELERRLLLGSKAVPKLRLRPKRTIHNGHRVRFRVKLPGPSAAHRRVEVQARSGRRWIRIARGRTGRDGHWHGSYRFRSTTGTQRYGFRAISPHSKGYPFQPGHSKIRHVRVRGSR